MHLSEPQNSRWFDAEDAETVFVFLHGILSNSEACWSATDPHISGSQRYWPEIVRGDRRLGDPAIYLAGYTTSIDAGDFGVADVASEVRVALRAPGSDGRAPPVSKPNLLFICHSLGGVVARTILERYHRNFVGKNIGLLLMASPSWGSHFANLFSGLMEFYNLQLGLELRTDSEVLVDIDRRFREFVQFNDLANLVMGEFCEHRFLLRSRLPSWLRRFLPSRLRLVGRRSAGAYVGASVIADTDHSTIVKPTGIDHPSHRALVDFYVHKFVPVTSSVTPARRLETIIPSVGDTRSPQPPQSEDVSVMPPATSLSECTHVLSEYFHVHEEQKYSLREVTYELEYTRDFGYSQRYDAVVEAVETALAAINAHRMCPNVPITDIRELAFRADVQEGRTFVLPVVDEPTLRRFVVLLHPPIAPGRDRRVLLRNRWPRGGEKISRRDSKDSVEWIIPAQLVVQVPRVRLIVRVPDDGAEYHLRDREGQEHAFKPDNEFSWVGEYRDVRPGTTFAVGVFRA